MGGGAGGRGGGARVHERPAQFLAQAQRLIAGGKGAEAQELIDRALAANPGDPLFTALAARIALYRVPSYHARMLRDHARNAAYARAIAALAPGRRVLDIGTGSGLLAMLAARAGAAHVYACEAHPLIAATARAIVAANGLGDRITVLPVHSKKLDRHRDLGGGAELVVSEIFAEDLLGEEVLPAIADARARLCAPGAAVLPQAASIRVALADQPVWPPRLGDVEGFDLSRFARHLDDNRHAETQDPQFALCSTAADLFRFDFTAETALERRTALTLVSSGGRISGIAQWLRIELGGGAVYENAPGGDDAAHWGIMHHALARPRETAPGEAVGVGGWHGQTDFAVWAEP